MTAAVPGRSLWVWRTSDPTGLAELSRVRQIHRWFVAVDQRAPVDPTRAIVAAAIDRGIAVDALGGDPCWIDDPASAVAWLDAAIATGWFARIHLDLEPHAHPAWESDRPAVARAYLALLAHLGSSSDVPIELDLAHWYHEVAVDGRRLDVAALELVDAVTILAYRNVATGPDGTLAIAAPTVGAAIAGAVPFRIGQETNALGDDDVARKQTFFGMPLTAMERALAAIHVGVGESAGYAGIAIHDAVGYPAIR